ncbi:MAG: 50S ribosomal protein L15 [bacterium]|nr:50S ribosomal protein L15 [bacterium]
MTLSNLKVPEGANKRRKIVGRGNGSGHGKTACKGDKGQKARSGGKIRRGFEGGQMPLYRRVPKRGFTSRSREKIVVINIEKLNCFKDGSVVGLEHLIEKGLLKSQNVLAKILGMGELKKKLNVKAHSFSKSAIKKIIDAGGTAEVI